MNLPSRELENDSRASAPRFGATIGPEGVVYAVWAPERERLEIEIEPAGGGARRCLSMQRAATGWFREVDPAGAAGDAYKFRIDGAQSYPDPASRAQRESVHGPSLVIDPRTFGWTDGDWRRPAWRDLVIYELHVGTFTDAGTFRGAIERLGHLRDLGVNAIELLPIAEFPGCRNWGYDGVYLYAPARAYGSPDDLRALVDAAHAHGIAVILDVVYNHLGPDGNYLAAFSEQFFHLERHTPWGRGFNFDGPNSDAVRDFFGNNPLYWMDEFHADGFRLDATHEIADASEQHLLAKISDAVHARGGYVVAEDARNEALLLEPTSAGGRGLDAVWADDFHHGIRVGQTRETDSYFGDFAGSPQELAETLEHGWLYRGQEAASLIRPRGTACQHLPPERFLHCISNHDQIGNRAFGERLSHTISPPAYRALSALLCLTPYTPMLFMGQEWAASSPFLFFTDHNAELGPLITIGRRREFSGFKDFSDIAALERIPDPQMTATFENSKLRWDEVAEERHAATLRLYGECLAFRHAVASFRPRDRASWRVSLLDGRAVALRFPGYLLIFHPGGENFAGLPSDQRWELILSSEDARFGGSGSAFNNTDTLAFTKAETLVLKAK